ncbi:hypothetical protein [Bacillus sp. AFS017336]|uniref:hypothetical protein n=1 Tax=Bacillaceae TaxID=186817 RepID=UPI000BF13FF1|nr:hypothetical protein [Bacillus sp. AFS017336]PEL13363.1 hypothetical protein CN601_05790 [Bacillus sp. AFS017336]
MKHFLIKILKSFIGTIVLDLFLLTFCLVMGSIFQVLHSFTWFGFQIIVLPFSILAFVISIVYFSKKEEEDVPELVEEINSEHSSRMEKYHQPENN